MGVDSTSTQKNTAETVNALIDNKDEEGYSTIFGQKIKIRNNLRLHGLDFSGAKKPAYLIACKVMLESKYIRWPKFFTGLRSQLSNYDPAKDKTNAGQIPQDLVSMLAMAAFAIRRFFYIDPDEASGDNEGDSMENGRNTGRSGIRYSSSERNRSYRSDNIPREETDWDEIDEEVKSIEVGGLLLSK